MATSFVPLNPGTGGRNAQTVQNTIGGTVVDANAVVLHDAAGLPLAVNGTVSTANSTATVLAAAGVFTGTSEDVSAYSTIAVTVFADVASATDGLSLQQSSNGTNWDNTDAYSIPAATGKTFNFPVEARYFRVVYTNGATLQAAFRLQTLYHVNAKKGSSVRPQDARTNDNDFEEVSAYLSGFNGTTWDRLRSTIANGLAVDVTRFPAATLGVTATAGTGVAATATLPAVVGQFHYISAIYIDLYATAARTGSATPVAVTTTNIPGLPQFQFDTAQAIGTTIRLVQIFETPWKSSAANTATTIVAPVATTGIWRINVQYWTGT